MNFLKNIFKSKEPEPVEERKPKFQGVMLQISDPQGDFEWTTMYPNPSIIENRQFSMLSLDEMDTIRAGQKVGFIGIAPLVTPKVGDVLLKHMASGRYMAMEFTQVYNMGDPDDMYKGEVQVIWFADTIKNLEDLSVKSLI